MREEKRGLRRTRRRKTRTSDPRPTPPTRVVVCYKNPRTHPRISRPESCVIRSSFASGVEKRKPVPHDCESRPGRFRTFSTFRIRSRRRPQHRSARGDMVLDVEAEVKQLCEEIKRLGAKGADGKTSVRALDEFVRPRRSSVCSRSPARPSRVHNRPRRRSSSGSSSLTTDARTSSKRSSERSARQKSGR